MARLLGIAKRAKKRAEMELLDVVEITLEKGVADDSRGKPGQRQVTVLTQEGWQAACAEAGVELPWTERRANLLIEGLDLHESAGQILKIGAVKLRISGETDPCERMEEAQPGLFSAMAKAWRGGVCCRVLQPGAISVGDEVELIHGE
jgi:MOSC domain-containing protein YiiM